MQSAIVANRRPRLSQVVKEIRACRICEAHLPHGPRPILRVGTRAKLCIIAQAPGIRVHETGLSFNDPSGDRLRSWLAIDRAAFYDESQVAVIGMGFCFPGHDAHGGDRPPRDPVPNPQCAPVEAGTEAALQCRLKLSATPVGPPFPCDRRTRESSQSTLPGTPPKESRP